MTTLAILPNWLGDLVMVEPALRALRAQGPVTGVVSPALAPLVREADVVDAVVVFDRRGADRGLTGLLRAARRLRGAERAVVFGPSLRAAGFAAATGSRQRIGVGGAGRELFLTDIRRTGRPPRTVHLADEWLAIVDPGAALPATSAWRVGPAGREGLRSLRAAEPALQGPFVAIAAAAMFGPAKEWPGGSFVDLAAQLRQSAALAPVFVGGPSDVATAQELAARCGGLSLAGRTDLPGLAAVLEAAGLFVGNDSGPMHLAAALGTPTVGIFGSTSPRWTAPRGRRVAVAGPAAVSCTPCFRRTCPFDRECLTGTSSADVLALGLRLLGAA